MDKELTIEEISLLIYPKQDIPSQLDYPLGMPKKEIDQYLKLNRESKIKREAFIRGVEWNKNKILIP